MSYGILAPFLLEAAEASRYKFFENRWKKLKCPNLLKPLGTIIQQNYWSFYPSEPFSFVHFNMIHPVLYSCMNAQYKKCCVYAIHRTS